jgi:hypothetical protein
MTKKIKEFSFCTCIINYDIRRNLLFVDYIKKGQLFYSLTITNLKTTILKKFLSGFDEDNAKDLFRNNIELL